MIVTSILIICFVASHPVLGDYPLTYEEYYDSDDEGIAFFVPLLSVSVLDPEDIDIKDYDVVDIDPGVEQLLEIKKSLDDTISQLQMIRTKIDMGSTDVNTDLDKTVRNIKKIEKTLRTNNQRYSASMKKSIHFSSGKITSDGEVPKPKFTTYEEYSVSTNIPTAVPSEGSAEKIIKSIPIVEETIITKNKGSDDKADFKKKWSVKYSN